MICEGQQEHTLMSFIIFEEHLEKFVHVGVLNYKKDFHRGLRNIKRLSYLLFNIRSNIFSWADFY